MKLSANTDYKTVTDTVVGFMDKNNMNRAADAMRFAQAYHRGQRKDGTPEFSHQMWQAYLAIGMIDLFLNKEDVLITIFLHDVVEDYPVSLNLIKDKYGMVSAMSVDAISKVIFEKEIKKTTEDYFDNLALDVNASACKGIDRIHNHQSMINAFTVSKQYEYVAETQKHILPMLKKAQVNFPEQHQAYSTIIMMLEMQIEMILHSLEFRWNELSDERRTEILVRRNK